MSKVVRAVVGVAVAVVGVVTGQPMLILQGASMTLGAITSKGSKRNSATGQRLNKQLAPEDFRKIVFGRTAGAADLRFWEVHGSKNTLYSEVVAVAGHRVHSFQEMYVENEVVPFSGVNATGTYSGALTRSLNNGAPGNAALAVGAGSYWNANSKFTGVAHYALRWTYSEKKLPNGIPQKVIQVVEGALVYDPRRDSTRGGSGTHRIDDQSTWAYATLDGNGVPIGRNNALQALWYLLGWKVQNPSTGEWVLVAGQGVDPIDIDVASFITAANDAEAQQFYTDMVLSTGDSHSTNRGIISCNDALGRFLDPGGLWTYKVSRDDTAVPAVTLTEDDVLEGSVEWVPERPMSDQYNRVVGTYIDPSTASLYQSKAYPQVKDTTYETDDGFKRRKTLDFQAIQSEELAQKAGRIVLNEGRYQGEFRATFNFKALQAQVWDVASLVLDRYGFDSTYRFRIRSQSLTATGIEMVLRVTHSSIWSAGSVTTTPAPSAVVGYDPRQEVPVEGLSVAQTTLTGSGGAAQDGAAVSWTAAPGNVRRTEGQLRVTSAASWMPAFMVQADVSSSVVGPLMPSSSYEVRVRHVSIHEVPGPWATVSLTTGANGRIVSATVAYADGTLIEALKPAAAGAQPNSLITVNGSGILSGIGTANIYVDNTVTVPEGTLAARPALGSYPGQQYLATDVGRMFRWSGLSWVQSSDVTAQHTAAAITGQGALATRNNVDLATGDVLNRSLAVLDSAANASLTSTAALVASRRKRLGSIIVPPVTTYEQDVGALFNSDGTVDVVFQWAWAGNEDTIDGFRVTYRQGRPNQGRSGAAIGGAMFFS